MLGMHFIRLTCVHLHEPLANFTVQMLGFPIQYTQSASLPHPNPGPPFYVVTSHDLIRNCQRPNSGVPRGCLVELGCRCEIYCLLRNCAQIDSTASR